MRYFHFSMLPFPYPWPVKAQKQIMFEKVEEGAFYINAETNGTLSLNVEYNNQKYQYNSQKLEFTNYGFVTFSVLLKNENCQFCINGINLETLDKEPEAVAVINVKSMEENPPQSFLPENFIHCQSWVDVRQKWFEDFRESKNKVKFLTTPKRQKTLEEQIIELNDEIIHLQGLLDSYGDHINIQIAISLRKLIYYKDDASKSQNYNPLLLRLANRANLALPIYAAPEDGKEKPEAIAKMSFCFENLPNLYKILNFQKIMDFQEWLNLPTLSFKLDPRIVSAKQFLGIYANTNASHYDEEIPLIVDQFRNVASYRSSYLRKFLTELGNVVVHLSQKTIEANLLLLEDNS